MRIHHWVGRRPVWGALAALFGWMIVASLSVAAMALLTGGAIGDRIPQLAGFVGATLVLLVVAWRGGWLRDIHVASPGSRGIWLLWLVLAAYDLAAGLFAFFPGQTLDPRWLFGAGTGEMWLLQIVVGPAEELFFRGAILAILIRAWGNERRGVVLALCGQAILFGLAHAPQALAGQTLAVTAANILHTCVFGLWVGALTLHCRSIWPAALIHTLANAVTLIVGQHAAWFEPYYLGYLRLTALELPLVVTTLWLALRDGAKEHKP